LIFRLALPIAEGVFTKKGVVQLSPIAPGRYILETQAKGYAADLATLGPGPSGSCSEGTADHACLMDNVLANSNCTAGTWCTKYGYKFSVSAEKTCPDQTTQENETGIACNYVVVATPVSGSTGRRSYCSTADAIIRDRYGSPLSRPITAEECSRWSPIS